MVEIKDKEQLSEEQIKEIVELWSMIWPPKEENWTLQGGIQKYRSSKKEPIHKIFLIHQEERLAAHANIFSRLISLNNKEMVIMALASVCVHPDFRGQDLGRAVVRQAFQFVDNGTFPCSVFQTQVPGFYEKLGAKIIHNRFVNSMNTKDIDTDPWWDPYIMVYPKEYPLAEGIIDLKGSGY